MKLTHNDIADIIRLIDASTLDGVGHYLMLEKPDEFNALLAEALLDIANAL